MSESTSPSKHQIKSTATRSALLEAASEVFISKGFERAQIDDIAKRAGRTRGAVYAQYKTKEQLFFALIERHMEKAFSDFEELVAGIEGSVEARLLALRTYYSKTIEPQNSILDLELKLYSLRHPEAMEELRVRYDDLFIKDTAGEYFGLKDREGRSKVDNRIIALEALKSGLVLASIFQPNRLTDSEVRFILSEVFDGLFPAEVGHKTRKPGNTGR